MVMPLLLPGPLPPLFLRRANSAASSSSVSCDRSFLVAGALTILDLDAAEWRETDMLVTGAGRAGAAGWAGDKGAGGRCGVVGLLRLSLCCCGPRWGAGGCEGLPDA